MIDAVDGAPSGAAAIYERYSGILFDVDGVLLYIDEPIPGAPETLTAVREHGVGVGFVTNNSSRTANAVAEALRKAGIAASSDEVITSSYAATKLLEPGTRCLVIGREGLIEPLRARGCVLVRAPEDAQAVVVGWDRSLVWDDLRRATLALARGARFVGTNNDVTYPAQEGPWPGNGAVIAALVAATGRQPEIAGKPEPVVYRAAAARLPSGRLLMVGDRPETDLVGATALGWDTALVLTGATRPDAVADVQPRPTWVLNDLRDILKPPDA